MGNERKILIITAAMIIFCLIAAVFITIETGTQQNSPKTYNTGNDTIRAQVLWYNDTGRIYTFKDYPVTDADPDNFNLENITKEKNSSVKDAAMIKFFVNDGSIEEAIDTRYLIDEEKVTVIIGSYTPVSGKDTLINETEPEPTKKPYPPVLEDSLTPLIDTTCAVSGGQITSFGYLNRGESGSLNIGQENFFSPGNTDKGQPHEFEPGIHHDVFTVFSPEGTTNLVWSLQGKTVTTEIVSPVIADFTIEPESGYAPLEVTITDKQKGQNPQNPITTEWPGITKTETIGQIFKQKYNSPGEYTIKQTLTNLCGITEKVQTLTVYLVDYTFVTENRTINFTDISSGNPEVFFWNFADGYSSWDKNPVHTYEKPGNYLVSHTVDGKSGKGTISHEIKVE